MNQEISNQSTSSSSSSSSSTQSNFKITYHPSNSNGPHQITCTNSDATHSTWPTIGPCPASIKSSTSWESIDSNSKISSKWLSILGKGLADSLGLMKCTKKEDWKLTNFPENYQLFNYIKGSLQDQYLFGSSHVRKFRTANEFLPHLQWLASSNSTLTCQCKYCAGTKSQTESISNLPHPSQQQQQQQQQRSRASNPKRKATRGPTTNHERFTSPENSSQEIVRKRPFKKSRVVGYRSSSEPPAIPPSNDSSEFNSTDQTQLNYLGPYLSRDLKRDLRTDRSNFREYELVWCNIEGLSIGNQTSDTKQDKKEGFDLGTKYWPGLCEEMVLESQACITIDDDDEDEDEKAPHKKLKKNSNRKSNESLINPNKLIVKRPNNKRLKVDLSKGTTSSSSFSKIKSTQKFLWKIRLLGLEEVIKREESSLLPWLFQPMNISEKFNTNLNPNSFNLTKFLLERRSHSRNRPKLNSFTSIETARISFLLALQIAANLEESWCTCDPYDLHPDEGDEDSEELIRRPMSIKPQVDSVNGDGNGFSVDKTPEKWYQTVWWGAEKIWIYDTVRLNTIEDDLPTELLNHSQDSSKKLHYIDSKDKAYFLKIDGIYRDEIEETLVTIGKVYDLVAISPPITKASMKPPPPNSPIVLVIDDDDDDKSTSKNPKPFTIEPVIPNIPDDSTDTSFEYLPVPPKGYKFRQLTPVGKSHLVYFDCIAGRYYSPVIKNRSEILANHSHRFLSKISSISTSSSASTGDRGRQIYGSTGKHKDLQRQNSSLFGLTAGRWNFMKCTKWRVNRMRSILEAERSAEEEMIRAFSRINGNAQIQ